MHSWLGGGGEGTFLHACVLGMGGEEGHALTVQQIIMNHIRVQSAFTL